MSTSRAGTDIRKFASCKKVDQSLIYDYLQGFCYLLPQNGWLLAPRQDPWGLCNASSFWQKQCTCECSGHMLDISMYYNINIL